MLDHPEKTARLVADMKASAPFDVVLTLDAVAALRKKPGFENVAPRQSVASVSYAGDEGGVLCHIQPENCANVIVISLTHVRMKPTQPLAAAVFAYQKHRVKKLKKAGQYARL